MNAPISVLFFGITRDLTGQSVISIPIQEATPVQDILDQLYLTYPSLSGIKSLLVAVNSEYAERDQLLDCMDELALIPPVSGG